jgi:hypothetical protein
MIRETFYTEFAEYTESTEKKRALAVLSSGSFKNSGFKSGRKGG